MRSKGVCRMCDLAQPVKKVEFKRASSPRCVNCGGMLEEKGNWQGPSNISAAVSSANISYSRSPSEFEIQAYIYNKLLDLGFNVRGEVCADGQLCIFDLVIFSRENFAKIIIEVKKHAPRYGNSRKQIKKYEKYGVPVVVVDTISGAKALINGIIHSKRIGKSMLEDVGLSPQGMPDNVGPTQGEWR